MSITPTKKTKIDSNYPPIDRYFKKAKNTHFSTSSIFSLRPDPAAFADKPHSELTGMKEKSPPPKPVKVNPRIKALWDNLPFVKGAKALRDSLICNTLPATFQIADKEFKIEQVIQKLGSGQHMDAYLCRLSGAIKGNWVVKVYKNLDNPIEGIRFHAWQLLHYAKNQVHLKNFTAVHYNFDQYSTPSLTYEACLEFVKTQVHFGGVIVEYIPEPFPHHTSFDPNNALWKQLQTLFANSGVNDIRRSNVGIKEGQLKLFDMLEHDEECVYSIEQARTFTSDPKGIEFLLSDAK